MNSQTYAQRLRVTFATCDTVKYVGHLDMHRAWERAIRRARLPLAYTQGYNPQPRIQFAAALPVGFTGEAELVDVYLNEELGPGQVLAQLAVALPSGITLLAAEPVARSEPSLQSSLKAAAYRVALESGDSADTVLSAVEAFLARDSAPRQRRRGQAPVHYDLRPLVLELEYVGVSDTDHVIHTVMRSESGATGRPDELLAELGYAVAPRRITRTSLLFRSQASTDCAAPD